MTEKRRQRNNGLRKLCGCPRREWAKCKHPWHFSFKWQGVHHRLDLDKHVGEHVDSKSAAIDVAGDLRKAIKAEGHVRKGGACNPRKSHRWATARPRTEKAHVEVERKDSVANTSRCPDRHDQAHPCSLTDPDGKGRAFGDWLAADVTVTALDEFKVVRSKRGVTASNRDLAFLRAMFNWGIRNKHVKETPFKLGTETVVFLAKEHARSRRLEENEASALLAACSPHLRGLVEAALETGCRKGEGCCHSKWHRRWWA